MYENAQPEIDRILALVKACPQDLQAKCFEVLLRGYVESQVPRTTSTTTPPKPSQEGDGKSTGSGGGPGAAEIPQEIRARFNGIAARAKVTPEQLAGLFDFTVDPFTLGPFSVEGKNSYEKARKVALLVAVRNYLATGAWSADWNEIKAVCNDHGCYDMGNFAKTMRESKGIIFRAVKVSESVDLSADGIKQAHTLLSQLVTDAAK